MKADQANRANCIEAKKGIRDGIRKHLIEILDATVLRK